MKRASTADHSLGQPFFCEGKVFGQRCEKLVDSDGKHVDGTNLHFAHWQQPLEWSDTFAKMVEEGPTPSEKDKFSGDELAEITGRLGKLPARFALAVMADVSRATVSSLGDGPNRDEAIVLMDRFSALFMKLGDRPS